MVDIIKILNREQEDTNVIHLYEEDGEWYAYERSAFYLSQMINGKMVLERHLVGKDALWLVRGKVDFDHLPHEYLISCADTECTIHYIPDLGFNDWANKI